MLHSFVCGILALLALNLMATLSYSAETEWTAHVISPTVSNPNPFGTNTAAGYAVTPGLKIFSAYGDSNSGDANAGTLDAAVAASGKTFGGGVNYDKPFGGPITTSTLRGGIGFLLLNGKLAFGGAGSFSLGSSFAYSGYDFGGSFNPAGPFRIGATNTFAGISMQLGKLFTPFFDYGYTGSVLKFGGSFWWPKFQLSSHYEQSSAARILNLTTYVGFVKSGGLIAAGNYDLGTRALGYSGALAFKF